MEAVRYASKKNVNPELGYTLRLDYHTTVVFEPHCHDYYEIVLTTQGTVIHLINGKKQLLPPGSLVFIRPDDVHTYIKETEFSFVNLAFSKDTAKKLIAYFGSAAERLLEDKMPPVLMLDNYDCDRMFRRLNELNTIDFQNLEKMQTKMKIVLTEFLSFFIDNQIEKTDISMPPWLANLITAINKPENMAMNLDDMAVYTGMTKEHISRSFRKYLHTTASDFMMEQKLNYCANLLLNSNLSVLDICYECGFQNPSWFHLNFKRKFGVTPKVFRNQ